MMKKHKVTVTVLNELKLKPRMSITQKTDLTIELKREILKNSELKWKRESDGNNATKILIDKKLEQEVFYRRCLRKHVILYENKNAKNKSIEALRKNDRVVCIGLDNVEKYLRLKFRASFNESKWIQIVDSKANRSFAKKYPLLNASLFTKKNPVGEMQGQTILPREVQQT